MRFDALQTSVLLIFGRFKLQGFRAGGLSLTGRVAMVFSKFRVEGLGQATES